jgi:hypothetical protein
VDHVPTSWESIVEARVLDTRQATTKKSSECEDGEAIFVVGGVFVGMFAGVEVGDDVDKTLASPATPNHSTPRNVM